MFAATLRVEEILRDVKLAEYYYEKLSPVYDFKSFTFAGASSRETLLDRPGPLHAPLPVYSYEDSLARLELSLTIFDENAATYVFRITDKHTGQVRDHAVSVPAGKSASVGGSLRPRTQSRSPDFDLDSQPADYENSHTC